VASAMLAVLLMMRSILWCRTRSHHHGRKVGRVWINRKRSSFYLASYVSSIWSITALYYYCACSLLISFVVYCVVAPVVQQQRNCVQRNVPVFR
jgi:hypothetical protein